MNRLMILMLVSLFASCGTINKKKIDNSALHTKWGLTILNGQPISTEGPIYLELTDDNKIGGFVGCNRITGTFTVENGSQIHFTQLATTRMACHEMELETEILQMLNSVDNFTVVDNNLVLSIGHGDPLATFLKMSDNEIVNKYWKLKMLDGQKVEMAENQEREQYFILKSDSTISGFAGCNHFNGSYELVEGNITFNENMAMTMMACPDVDVDESAFIKVFELTDNYTIDGDTLSLNSNKTGLLAVFEAVYFH